MERFRFFLLLCLLQLGINISVHGRIIPFPGRYNTIQDCIDAAFPGDTVLIEEGYYFENIHFRGKKIIVASHFIFDNDTSHIRHTIIDGSCFTDSLCRSTVNMNMCRDTASVLKGLTITGGGGSLIGLKPNEHWGGGGILIHESSGKIENNIIRDNSMDYDYCVNTGGGILASAIDGQQIVIRGNLIQSNVIQSYVEADAGGLCAVAAKDGHILIENNRILGNRSICLGNDIAHGGGVSLFGIYPEGASLIFRNNYVAYNRTSAIQASERIKAFGGGINVIYFDFPSDSRVLNPFLIICKNIIHDNYSSEWGGGISVHAGNEGMHKYAPVCPQIFLIRNKMTGNRSDFGPGIHNLNTAIVLLDNVLDDDLSGEDNKEIYNTDINYAYINDGIINAYGNKVKGGFHLQPRIYSDFPIIHSHAHRWKVKNISSDKVKLSFVPPPWLQWWALSLYFLALGFIFWLYRKYLFYRFNLKAALELEKQEKERILQLDQVRSRFFANISHEFRTPITLIDAPLRDLIEDDSDQLRTFMIRHLEDEFRVLQAENGQTGLEIALQKQPALIISDLMMPEMDGGEMVERLRNDERSCHIPIIMLTAKGDLESKLDCFEKGSDAFMEKPFRMEELKVRIHQLTRERKRLKEHYLELFKTENEAFKEVVLKAGFLPRFEDYIRENLGDPELSVEKISRELGLSRVQLYRKAQHSTGMSPGEWVRNVRLARASQLFREGAASVTEVMLEVGFTNHSHFAASFRELYGSNPSAYRKGCIKS